MTTLAFEFESTWRFVKPSVMRSRREAKHAARQGQEAKPRWCITHSGEVPPYYTLCGTQRFARAEDLVRSISGDVICPGCIAQARTRPDCPLTINKGAPHEA